MVRRYPWLSAKMMTFMGLLTIHKHFADNSTVFYSADIGMTTATTSNLSSTCVVLALVAGRRDSASSSQSATFTTVVVSAAFQSAILLFKTVYIASEVHFNASRSLTQPCLTA